MSKREKFVVWSLRLRHWQVFLLVYGAGILINVVSDDPGLKDIPLALQLLYTSSALFFGLGWLYSTGDYFGKKASVSFAGTTAAFKIVFSILMIALGSIVLIKYTDTIMPSYELEANIRSGGAVAVWLWLLMMLMVVSAAYCFYFIASRLESVEANKKINGKDCLLSWFLLVIFPIGIWVLQPRINQLYSEQK